MAGALNRGLHLHKMFPPCAHCGYRWPQVLDITNVIARTDGKMETVVMCPCGKSGILLRMVVSEARLLDIEGAKTWTADAETQPAA